MMFCHCGDDLHYGYDGNLTHHRGMCEHCDAARCDAFPGDCGRPNRQPTRAESCPKCGGTGWYQYDDIHSTICDLCCRHEGGLWWLTEDYFYKREPDSKRWCCRSGCGKTWFSPRDYVKEMMT